MKLFSALLLAVSLCGCGSIPSLNSDSGANHSCSEQKKPCGCAGTEQCSTKMPDSCSQCCTADDCRCNQVTFK